VCPYRMGERVRALKLPAASGMLMWDRGLPYAMAATLAQGCDYLGHLPMLNSWWNKPSRMVLLDWIAPSGKLKRKGCQRIQVRVIEYTIDPDQPEVQQVTV